MNNEYKFVNVNYKFAPPIFPYKKREDLYKWAIWRSPLDGHLPKFPDMNDYERWVPVLNLNSETPNFEGVYILGIRYLLDEPVFPVYIGESQNINKRINNHINYIKGRNKGSGRYDDNRPTNLVSLLRTISEPYYWYVTWIHCQSNEKRNLQDRIIHILKDHVINERTSRELGSRAPRNSKQPYMEKTKDRANKLTNKYIEDYLKLKDQELIKPMLAYYVENQIDFD